VCPFFLGDIAPDVEGFVELWTFYSSSGSRAAAQLKIDGERSLCSARSPYAHKKVQLSRVTLT